MTNFLRLIKFNIPFMMTILSLSFMHISCTQYSLKSGNTNKDGQRKEFGTYSDEMREHLQQLEENRQQVIRDHTVYQEHLEEEQTELEENIRRVTETLKKRGSDILSPDHSDISTEIHNDDTSPPLHPDLMSSLPLLKALSKEELEEMMNEIVYQIEQSGNPLDQPDQEHNLLLQQLNLVNNLLAEKRNEGFEFNDQMLTDLTSSELEEMVNDYQQRLEVVNRELSLSTRALTILETSSPDSYQHVRAKIFPVEKSHSDRNFPTTEGEDLKYVKLQNKNGFQVQKINPASNAILENWGQAHTVELFFECPDQAFCENNRLVLDEDPRKTFYFRSSDNIPFSAAIVPLKPISSQAGSFSEDKFTRLFESGFTQIQWGRRHSGSFLYAGFFRGSWNIQYARRFKQEEYTSSRWSAINIVDVDEYLLSVIPGEINPKNQEDLKIQIFAARTYVLKHAYGARTRRSPRSWDVLPSTLSQLYKGGETEEVEYYPAIIETRGQVLITDNRLSWAEFFAFVNPSTFSTEHTEYEARNVPPAIGYPSKYRRSDGTYRYGHGRGLCQDCASELAVSGWPASASRQPTPGACIPADPTKPWTAEEIACYFYNDTRIGYIAEILDI